ncbi:MAG: hypothetical protein A2Z20_10210 [Bdellovibrionales bacterium RBG_16_40_8]|nr:MAG: hypothetical protein A2Z20_10210 [Bdellovibrionales bacterium RBG_16_40_8]
MTTAHLIHTEIVERLRAENIIDITTLPSDRDREDMNTQVRRLIDSHYFATDAQIKNRVEAEFFAAGPLAPLITDSEITEIIVNGSQTIWYEKAGLLYKHPDHFFSPISYQNFLQRLTTDARIQVNLDRPFTDGYWRQFRVHLIIPPLAQGGAHLSLRRHPDNPWTLPRLEEVRWASPEALKFLKKMVCEHMSFMIVGATSSGKTSVLSACLQSVDATERVIIIEDTSEINAPNEVSAKLLSRHDTNGVLQDVDQTELLRQALRMRPDRLVMGEVRGA